MLCDKVRDESDTATFCLVKTFNEGETDSGGLHATFETGAQAFDKGVWNDKDKNISAISSVTNVCYCNLHQKH